MKRISYECETCGAEKYVRMHNWETPPGRITCKECGQVNGMAARPPRIRNHFHPTKGAR